MKTFFITWLITYGIALTIWLIIMLQKPQPSQWKEFNIFEQNWKEGGQILLIFFSISAFALSVGISKFILWMNFLEG